MSDVKLLYDPDTCVFDVDIFNGDLMADDGLETSVLISLFSDRRRDEAITEGEARDMRGWWGDDVLPAAGDKIGSHLWLLARSKLTAETQEEARDYARAALQWMLDDGVAESVSVTFERSGTYNGILTIAITEPSNVVHTYKVPWERQHALQ